MSSKNLLRKELKQKISVLTLEEREIKSLHISEHITLLIKDLLSSSRLVSPINLGLYAPMKDEVHFKNLSLLRDDSVVTSFPHSKNGVMEFRKATFGKLVETDIFGVKIKTPPKSSELTVPDILLIPGLGFDKKGGRLGRGKGFYDRFLAEFKGIKIGVCFEVQILGEVPREDHDVLVDYVVSESGWTGTDYN